MIVKANQHITYGNSFAAHSGGSGSIRLGRLKAPTPHSTTVCQPWSCSASPYTGWQTVVNLERYSKGRLNWLE
jgi:hypothetical protein